MISAEREKVKLLQEEEKKKNDKLYQKLLIRKRLVSNKDKEFQKHLYKSIDKSCSMVQSHINIFKKMLKEKNFTQFKKVENSNCFISNLYLSIAKPYEQMFNTRLYGKLLDDEAFLKELYENEKIQCND